MYCLLGGQLFVLRGLSCLWRGLGYSSLEYDLPDIARQGVYLYYRDGVDVRRAFLLHRANYVLVLIREKTMLPFLFYVLFISTNPDFFPLKSTSVGVFCLILAIYQLFTTYHDPEAREGLQCRLADRYRQSALGSFAVVFAVVLAGDV